MAAELVVRLPTAIGAHQISHILRSCNFFCAAPSLPSRVTLSFHPQKTHLDPLGVALLGSWAAFWRDRGAPIKCQNLHSPGLAYAERVGLLRELGTKLPKPLTEHEETGRFVPLTRVASQAELSQLGTAIGGILRVPHLIEFVQYVLLELVRNTLEHAEAPAFVCAQFYPKDKRVTLGVVDCGRGIPASLAAHGLRSDREAVLAALRPGVSGKASTPYSAPDNAGLGLYFARGIAKASGRLFVLASGQAAFKQTPSQVGSRPFFNPEDENHLLVADFPAWHGTLVGINIRGFDARLDAFMARMKNVLNTGTMMQPAPKLHFT